MAICEKTVWFAFPQLADVTDRTETTLQTITLHIPEANPVFTSVYAEVGFQDVVTATGSTIGENRVALRLAGAAFVTITELDDIVHSGENIAGVLGPYDFTAHFAANWSGASMTCQARVYFELNTGSNTRNISYVLRVTYLYDDAAATQVKTVAIPIDSRTGYLPTAPAEISPNSIPQLTGAGGILPEAGVIVRDWFILVEGNDGAITNADFSLVMNVDGANSFTFPLNEAALISQRFCRYFYKLASVPDPSVQHALNVNSTLGTRFPSITFTLYVTYTFTRAGTVRTLNSVHLPVNLPNTIGANSLAAAARTVAEFSIQEPGIILQRTSALRLNWIMRGSVGTIFAKCGAQSYQGYTTAGSVVVGMCSLQRIFSDADFSLRRGNNLIDISCYVSSASISANTVSGYLIINYESDISSAGVGSHNHTVYKTCFVWDSLAQTAIASPARAFAIPHTNYFLNGHGFCLNVWQNTVANAVILDVAILAAESASLGFSTIFYEAYENTAELTASLVHARAHEVFRAYPQDITPNRLDIEAARVYRMQAPVTLRSGGAFIVTYHALTFTAAGVLSGHNNALPTELALVKASNGDAVQTQILPAGTAAYSFTLYDNTEDYFIDAFQSASLVGRSARAKAA